ncbi:MAG TPA: sulfotransferase family protein [Blastocatellia bacterium]|nr:sulfotransferase family protein [Blastocatellia bacterium]
MGVDAQQLDGWIPIRLYWNEQGPLVDWCWIGSRRFTEPFFNQTINECLQLPFSSLFRPQTTIETLAERYALEPGPLPAGLIFHMSRSGSTLVSRMLAALQGSVVISEAGPIDSVLRARFRDASLSDETRAEWLKWIVSALGLATSQSERRLFIKFDSWGIFDLELVRAAFPNVPWIFLYRNPLDVLASQLNQRGAHMVPGAIEPELFGFTLDEVFEMQPEDYCARVLARICDRALQHHKTLGGLLINYNQLPDAVWTSISDHFGIVSSASERDAQQIATRFDAKNQALPFEPNSRPGRKPPNEAARYASEQWLEPAYGKLEAARLNSGKDLRR